MCIMHNIINRIVPLRWGYFCGITSRVYCDVLYIYIHIFFLPNIYYCNYDAGKKGLSEIFVYKVVFFFYSLTLFASLEVCKTFFFFFFFQSYINNQLQTVKQALSVYRFLIIWLIVVDF